MKKTIALITLSTIFVCLNASGQAQQRASGSGLAERFKQLDRNGDGRVSREEGGSLPFFDAADNNKDGFLTTEEVQAYFADWRTARPAAQPPAQPGTTPSAPAKSTGKLTAVDAVFELCVRDVEACAKFYRDGIGMREVEPATASGALLEWAGCYLRLRKVTGEKPAAVTGSLMKQMLASNGFRWFSLWFNNPAAISERLVKAGYRAPVRGPNVSMTHDPDGNVVEIMGVPRSASGETFTWGMAVSDEVAARKFYGEVLGLHEYEPWNLPIAGGLKMYLFATGAGRVKFSAPPGQRPREADAGPDAAGLRSVTLRVSDLAAAREGLVKRGAKLTEGDGGLLVTDPDGNRIYIAALTGSPPSATRAAGSDTPSSPAESEEPSRRPSPGRSAGLASAMGANAEQIFKRLDRNNDGRISAEELPRPQLLSRADRDGDGSVSLRELRAYSAQQGVPGGKPVSDAPPTPFLPPAARGEPPLKPLPNSDASRDATGRGQLFESIHVANLTDRRAGMNGLAVVDLNRDGLVDIVATYSPPRGSGGQWGKGELLRVFINEGDFKFRTHAVELRDSPFTLDAFGRGQVPALVDFNNDGLLDLFVTRHARLSGGRPTVSGAESPGNSLFLADGDWDVFRDVSEKMGIRNEDAYNRQPCFGDVNRDGWLDIAIGCDNIKAAWGGFPHSRLYVFQPGSFNGKPKATALEAANIESSIAEISPTDASGLSLNDGTTVVCAKFEEGRFTDLGGTELAPDFGGFYNDSARDKAGPDINLRDLDNDGDLDLVQSFHVDVREPLLPYWPGEYRQGVFCWKNLLVETGKLQFEKVTGNGLACEARLRYDRERQVYVPEGKAPGLPYLATADVDNDGLQDVLAVGPASPGWAPRAEYVGGRFWHNLGGFRFEERTHAAGLKSLEWTFRDWVRFFDQPISTASLRARPGKLQTQPGLDRPDPLDGRPYFADAAFADFDNDGWIDLVVQDRHEGLNVPARAILFMNKGDGTFDPKPTTYSGLDSNGICFEVADLNNDGLVDLIFAADPDNSGVATTPDRYESKVYWNTGEHGARDNHWIRLTFSGLSDAELIGARVELTADGQSQYRWIQSNPSYKSSGALEAHFGLGKATSADVRVALLNGKAQTFTEIACDKVHTLALSRP
ncbi:MAG: FG-GAP-like repeat-containing protein [Planctomycetota bacterium]